MTTREFGPWDPNAYSPQLITRRELCTWLSITNRHLQELTHRRAIPYVKVGHNVMFNPDHIRAWLAANSYPDTRRAAFDQMVGFMRRLSARNDELWDAAHRSDEPCQLPGCRCEDW